jgi:serine phosphatase RsbU (regulator of sigma subunit)
VTSALAILSGLSKPIFNDSVTWFLIFSNLSLLIGGWFYFRSLNRKFEQETKKLSEKLSDRSYNVMMQKWDLERRNLSITQQNREIIESLHYAKTIQSAIMPKDGELKKYFRDGFVFYRPKDIVSGDFYFLEEANGKIYFAVADCTGHGVAGAFMSMVGTALLKQIIIRNKVADPSRVLKLLNDGILEALRQKETSSHGGMDISLCVIDKVAMKLDFAGANRPLILIRQGQMEVIRPDKLPIGGMYSDDERDYHTTSMEINIGDRIYMYSDGYADQFGGTDGRKIMTRKFKELLMEVHQQEMHSQMTVLESHFDNWKGRFEQVDDVLVAGAEL